MGYEAERLWENHREIIRRIVLGQKNKKIAIETGYSEQTVSNVKNSMLGQAKIEELEERADEQTVDVKRRIKELAPKAIDVMEAIIVGDEEKFDGQPLSPSLRHRTSKDVVEKAGHVAPNKVEGKFVGAVVDQSYIDELKERANKSSKVVSEDEYDDYEEIE